VATQKKRNAGPIVESLIIGTGVANSRSLRYDGTANNIQEETP
jgi:hypothetical protein